MIRRIAPSKAEILARKKAQIIAKIDEQQKEGNLQEQLPVKNKTDSEYTHSLSVSTEKQKKESDHITPATNLFAKKRQKERKTSIVQKSTTTGKKSKNISIQNEPIKYPEKYEDSEIGEKYPQDKSNTALKKFENELSKMIAPKKNKVQAPIEFNNEFKYLEMNKDVGVITQKIILMGEIKREYSLWKRYLYADKSEQSK